MNDTYGPIDPITPTPDEPEKIPANGHPDPDVRKAALKAYTDAMTEQAEADMNDWRNASGIHSPGGPAL